MRVCCRAIRLSVWLLTLRVAPPQRLELDRVQLEGKLQHAESMSNELCNEVTTFKKNYSELTAAVDTTKVRMAEQWSCLSRFSCATAPSLRAPRCPPKHVVPSAQSPAASMA